LTRRLGLGCLSLLLLAGCEIVNAIHACDDAKPANTQVNQHSDQNEAIASAQSAADLGNGRVIVTFVVQSIAVDTSGNPQTSQVWIAIVDVATGNNIALCNGQGSDARDAALSDASEFAYAPSVAAAPLSIEGNAASALVSWTEGITSPQIHMRFVDDDGCGMAAEFSPYQALGAVGSLSWSPQKQAVLATINDGEQVLAGLVSDTGPAPFSTIATSVGGTGPTAANAIAPDGTAFVAWNDLTLGPRGALLDSTGDLVAAGTDRHGLDLGFPATSYEAGGASTVTVAGHPGGFAVLQDASVDPSSRPAVYLRYFDLSGAPLGDAHRVDSADTATQGAPAGAFLPDDLLVVSWKSRAHGGTVAGLYGLDGAARFNAASCSDSEFLLGPDTTYLDTQSALVVDGNLWIFYTGEDSLGAGVELWRLPASRLWPAMP
jgi:hypothetical protein